MEGDSQHIKGETKKNTRPMPSDESLLNTMYPIVKKAQGLSGVPNRKREARKNEIKASVEAVSTDVIRRHRIKYSDAICYELEESGLTESAAYIRQVIELNREIRDAHGPDTWVWLNPTLEDSKEQLNKLREALSRAEEAKKAGNRIKQSEAVLKIGIYFMEMPWAWWWLAEQLLIDAVTVAQTVHSDGGCREGTARYVLGRFLFLQLQDPEAAKEHLRIARELSNGKKWNLDLSSTTETVFFESCALLCKVLITIANEFRLTDPLKAGRICSIAVKRANDTKSTPIMIEAFMELGACNFEGGDIINSIRNFNRALEFSKKIEDNEGICKCLMHLALAYTRTGQLEYTESNLLRAAEFAAEKKIPYQKAQAERYLGEFYLNNGYADKGTPHLLTAFNIFHELKAKDEAQLTRCLYGICAGTELMYNYTRIILSSGPRDYLMSNLSKMCLWKGHREPFWVQTYNTILAETASIYSEDTIENELFIREIVYRIADMVANPLGVTKSGILKAVGAAASMGTILQSSIND